MRLRFILGEVATGLRRNATMALSVVLVTFVSLTFVGAAALIQIQVDQLRSDWYGQVEVSIYMCAPSSFEPQCESGPVTGAQEDAIYDVLTTGSVADLVEPDGIYYESREEVLEAIQSQDDAGAFASLTAADMGPVYRVSLRDPEQFQVVADATAGLPGVESVDDQREIFSELFRFLNVATIVAAALAVVMMVAAMLLITTTIRLSALSRRRETTIMRMVGSSRSLIQLPFMLEGAVAATLGAAMAIAGLWFSVRYLVEDWLKGSITWVDYVTGQDVWTVAPWLLAIAIGLAAAASLVTLGRYTRA